MPRARRLVHGVALAATLICISAFIAVQQSITLDLSPGTLLAKTSEGCAELKILRRELGLPSTVQYAKRIIRTQPVDNYIQQSMVRLDQDLMPTFMSLNLDNVKCRLRDDLMTNGGARLVVEHENPVVSNVDDSGLLFGASTSLERLERAIPQMARWLAKSRASLVVNVRDSGNLEGMSRVQKMAEAAGIDAAFLPDEHHGGKGDEQNDEKHFNLVKRLYRRREANHKWFVIIDDDTFFLSLQAVMMALEPYDPAKPWYIGALSEDWSEISQDFGYKAYSGAAIFLSAPVLDVLHDNFDSCMKTGIAGDRLYSDCIYAHTSPPVQLTQLRGLHQMDLRDDASGWYEAGLRPILSLHHYDSWYRYPVQYGHMVSDVCGQECFLQRYRFNENVILTNGYSITQYPGGLENIDLGRVEGTFPSDAYQFTFSLGALRPKSSAQEKISWRLEYASKARDGSVRQFYVKRQEQAVADEQRLKSKVESVFEVEWKS